MATTTGDARLYETLYGTLYAAGMVRLVMLGVEAFRLRLKERFEALENGEETIIQRRGKVIGALVKIDDYRFLREQRGDPTDL